MQAFLEELEHESIGTRKFLALVPEDKMDWAPHKKSMKMKDLALHIADLPTWINFSIAQDTVDFQTQPYNPPTCKNSTELLTYFEENLEKAKQLLIESDDKVLDELWTLRDGDQIYLQYSKLKAVRHSFCQVVHHRAQLGVYLRLLDIPIPGVYGPSADEMGL